MMFFLSEQVGSMNSNPVAATTPLYQYGFRYTNVDNASKPKTDMTLYHLKENA